MVDPFIFVVNCFKFIVSSMLKKSLFIGVVIVFVLISHVVVQIAPAVQQTIGAATQLVEKINETQLGFQVILTRIDGMSETISRIERIVNKIPVRLLNDENEWELDDSEEIVYDTTKQNECSVGQCPVSELIAAPITVVPMQSIQPHSTQIVQPRRIRTR